MSSQTVPGHARKMNPCKTFETADDDLWQDDVQMLATHVNIVQDNGGGSSDGTSDDALCVIERDFCRNDGPGPVGAARFIAQDLLHFMGSCEALEGSAGARFPMKDAGKYAVWLAPKSRPRNGKNKVNPKGCERF